MNADNPPAVGTVLRYRCGFPKWGSFEEWEYLGLDMSDHRAWHMRRAGGEVCMTMRPEMLEPREPDVNPCKSSG